MATTGVMLKAKTSKADLWREFGLERPSSPRYEGLKGIYWWLFSRKRRQEDFRKYGGECIDQCGKFASTWQDFDGGHFISAGQCGFGLLFDPLNVHGQLKACNNPTWSPNSSIGFARGIDKRYGAGTSEALYERYRDAHFKGKTTKQWGEREYRQRIIQLLSWA